MHESRPNPDALLARVQQQEQQDKRGRLKIFFGMAAGVGKTYAMLQAAHEKQANNIKVLIGWVETHKRAETEALLGGLERLPALAVEHRGAILSEFDLDAALAKHPQLILMDELAHTNAPGSRHPKRWQDVEELLQTGIDVYTTVNVQHLESLNDVIAHITGVIVRETVPDRVIEQADEIELIDLAPDDLLQRLQEGKVYLPHQAANAVQHFFRKGNLIALRELALRRTAERVDQQMQHYRQDHAIANPWPTVERFLVCIGPNPLGSRLIRATRRMASLFRAEWIVTYVETPGHTRLSDPERNQIIQNLRLAEQLGAETVTLNGIDVSTTLLHYAQRRNVTKIVLGKPIKARWREVFFGSIVDDIVRASGAIDVHVITGDHETSRPTPIRALYPSSSGASYGRGVAVVLLCTLIVAMINHFYPAISRANLMMAYLLGIIFVSTRYGRGPSILASILSVAAFDFFFVDPFLTFSVSDTQYLLTFAAMLVLALVISTLATRMQQQAQAAQERERHTAALYALSRDLASTRGAHNLLAAAIRHTTETFDAQVSILTPNEQHRLTIQTSDTQASSQPADEDGVARWVYDHGETAGLGTHTLAGADALYLPLNASQKTLGVMRVQPHQERQLLEPEQFHLLEAFVNQTALALERAHLARDAEHAKVQIETERMRSSLLSSVSHDLRTPLATITGATTTLLDESAPLDPITRRDLTQAIAEEAERLNRLVRNLLDMTRLESGTVIVQKEWQLLEEVIGAALTRLDSQLQDRPLDMTIPPDLPLVPMDVVLIEQALVNVLENALKYTPAASPISIIARADGATVTVDIADRGPGLAPGTEMQVFDKFYRTNPQQSQGVGLGLSIAAAIVQAHAGTLQALQRPDGGAMFRFTLPVGGTPPAVESDADNPTNGLLENAP